MKTKITLAFLSICFISTVMGMEKDNEQNSTNNGFVNQQNTQNQHVHQDNPIVIVSHTMPSTLKENNIFEGIVHQSLSQTGLLQEAVSRHSFVIESLKKPLHTSENKKTNKRKLENKARNERRICKVQKTIALILSKRPIDTYEDYQNAVKSIPHMSLKDKIKRISHFIDKQTIKEQTKCKALITVLMWLKATDELKMPKPKMSEMEEKEYFEKLLEKAQKHQEKYLEKHPYQTKIKPLKQLKKTSFDRYLSLAKESSNPDKKKGSYEEQVGEIVNHIQNKKQKKDQIISQNKPLTDEELMIYNKQSARSKAQDYIMFILSGMTIQTGTDYQEAKNLIENMPLYEKIDNLFSVINLQSSDDKEKYQVIEKAITILEAVQNNEIGQNEKKADYLKRLAKKITKDHTLITASTIFSYLYYANVKI